MPARKSILEELFGDVIREGYKQELAKYKTDIDKVEYLIEILINSCTDSNAFNAAHYKYLREHFIGHTDIIDKLPDWFIKHENLNDITDFIKSKNTTHSKRRTFIREGLNDLLKYLSESTITAPHKDTVYTNLKKLSVEHVGDTWGKALNRKDKDPDGAITSARSLIESVLKTILDEEKITYNSNPSLHELYKLVANTLNLKAEQHKEPSLKKILGNCSSIITELGLLRNDVSDAHGKGKNCILPSNIQAEFIVNLAGTICLFIVQNYEKYKNNSPE